MIFRTPEGGPAPRRAPVPPPASRGPSSSAPGPAPGSAKAGSDLAEILGGGRRCVGALEAAGFRRDRSGAFRLGPRIVLSADPASAHWFRVRSGDIFFPGASALDEAASPRGPYKLVPGRRPGSVRLIADLPLALDPTSAADTEGEADAASPDAGSAAWAADLAASLRAVASGGRVDPPVGPGLPPPSPVLRWLAERSREAMVDPDGVRVWALFGEVGRSLIGGKAGIREDRGGACIEVLLAESAHWGAASIDALAVTAARVNDGLRLVRLVRGREGGRRPVVLQVHLGSLPVLSPWLDVALDALHAAARDLSLEVPALVAPAIAKLVLEGAAAAAARPSPPGSPAGSSRKEV